MALTEAICHFDIVTEDKPSLNAAKRLAKAVVSGAGSEDALSSHLNAAIAAALRIVTGHHRAAPEVVTEEVEDVNFAPTRINSRPLEPNRFGPFSRQVSYSGWKRSLHNIEWFDSTPERTLANLLDADVDVLRWARIQRGELVVEWANGRYSPDFYACVDDVHYLLEVKADKEVGTDLVQAKKAAAEQWARFVTDHGANGAWRYLLVPESVLKTARTVAALLNQLGGS